MEKIKLIFLDIDGVLNYLNCKAKVGSYLGIEDKKLSFVKKIVDSTNAKIVITSAWKENWFQDKKDKDKQDDLANYLDMKFAKFNLEIFGTTYGDDPFNKGLTIKQYIKLIKAFSYKVKSFVIIDDETFDFKKEGLKPYLVKTDFNTGGLNENHVKKAIEILNK